MKLSHVVVVLALVVVQHGHHVWCRSVSSCDASDDPDCVATVEVDAKTGIAKTAVAGEPGPSEEVVAQLVGEAEAAQMDEAGQSVLDMHKDSELAKKQYDFNEPISVTFWNHMKKTVAIVWKNVNKGQEDVTYSELEPNKQTVFTTYQGHVWYARDPETGENLQEITMFWEQSIYSFDSPEIRQQRNEKLEKEKRDFMREYKKRTGRNWLSVYPRGPVGYHMWPPIEVGHEHKVNTTASHWINRTVCENEDHELFGETDPEKCVRDVSRPKDVQREVTLRTLSVSPQVYAIDNCLSEDEADLIVEMVQGRLTRSLVSSRGIIDPDRTSQTCWVNHNENEVMDNIFDRIADILKIPRYDVKNMRSAEHLQVVRYEETQEYKTHHDYMDPAIHEDHAYVMRGQNRLATFLFYLQVPEEGGGTGFPKSTAGPEDEGIVAKMPKGGAVLFYSMLPDGNLDIESLHAGLPVEKGIKYISNLWVWDPRFR